MVAKFEAESSLFIYVGASAPYLRWFNELFTLFVGGCAGTLAANDFAADTAGAAADATVADAGRVFTSSLKRLTSDS